MVRQIHHQDLTPILEKDERVKFAYLFGSAARGEDTERSDIDVLVIGNEKKRRDRALFAALGGERIKIVFFTPMEFSMLSRKDKPFYDAIERDKVRLL